MTMNNTRENLVYLAKLAEQAERFDDMVPARVETRPNLEARGIRRSTGPRNSSKFVANLF